MRLKGVTHGDLQQASSVINGVGQVLVRRVTGETVDQGEGCRRRTLSAPLVQVDRTPHA